jgi:hypothetical protein
VVVDRRGQAHRHAGLVGAELAPAAEPAMQARHVEEQIGMA